MGVLLALLGALLFSIMNVAIRKGVRSGDGDNGVVTTVAINVAVFTTIVIGVVLSTGVPAWDRRAFLAFAAAGLASTYVGRTLLYSGIRHIGAARAAAIKNATPVVTLVIALTILGERLAPGAAVGIALVLIGVFLLIRESVARTRSAEPSAETDDLVEVALESEALAEGTTPGIVPAASLRDRTRSYVSHGLRRQAVRGISLSIASAVVFGSAHALRKVGMDILPDALLGATVGAWAALLAMSVSAGVQGRLGGLRTSIAARRPYFWLAGLVGTFGQLSFFAALAFAPVSHVGVVASSEIVFTVLIASLVAQRTEQITRRLVVPASLVFGGAVVIALGR